MMETEHKEHKQSEESKVAEPKHDEPLHIGHKKPSMSPIKYYQFILAMAIVVLLLASYGTYNIYKTNNYLGAKIEKINDIAKPAEISIITVKDKLCIDCSDIKEVITKITSLNVNVTSEENLDYNSEVAKGLVDKYDLIKIPSVIIKGEIGKINLEGFDKRDDALVLNVISPPYLDTATNNVKGLVSSIIINAPSCDECFNVTAALDQLKSIIKVKDERIIKYNSNEAKELINKYNITLLPTMILSENVLEYQSLSPVLEKLGSVEEDGSYVLREVAAPYYNATSGKVLGLVSMTMLVDESCKECYNASQHKQILARFNLVPVKEELVDISSNRGKDIISKYKIASVPTIILSKEANAYNALNSAWKSVGSIEEDGSYIFRKLDILGVTYKDMNTNSTVKAKQ